MGKQGQPRPPRDNGPDTDMCADGLWFARPGSATHKRLTQSVADPVPVANLTGSHGKNCKNVIYVSFCECCLIYIFSGYHRKGIIVQKLMLLAKSAQFDPYLWYRYIFAGLLAFTL